ncbi:hypothetical protein PV325_009445 [Microctonus aethiopoides]|nr:hypothetical protein PV325_009445 [Microctonus aethiopoides]KAK0091872.1 hypothetical protein PV326_002590 [Microctonus aethiopoides]
MRRKNGRIKNERRKRRREAFGTRRFCAFVKYWRPIALRVASDGANGAQAKQRLESREETERGEWDDWNIYVCRGRGQEYMRDESEELFHRWTWCAHSKMHSMIIRSVTIRHSNDIPMSNPVIYVHGNLLDTAVLRYFMEIYATLLWHLVSTEVDNVAWT